MRCLQALLVACFLLVGCPGENVGVGAWRSYDIINGRLCFTVDKSDVLSRYSVSSMQGEEYRDLATAEFQNLTYPNTCIKIPLTHGYIYQTSYTLNDKVFRYNFFIDNNGLILSTKAGE